MKALVYKGLGMLGLSVMAVFLLVAALSSTPSATAAPSPNEVFNLVINIEPGSLDPHKIRTFEIFWLRSVYEPLVDLKGNTIDLEGVLAASWTVSQDGKTYVFKIRPGVKFHDGTPLTAEAVKTSFDRFKEIRVGPAYVLDPVENYAATDGSTFTVTLKQPFAPFLYTLKLLYIVSPTAIRQHAVGSDLAQDWLDKNSAGTGPYVLKEWNRGTRVVFERFEGYWGGWQGKHLREVRLLFVTEVGTARLMLEGGQADFLASYPIEALPAFRSNPALQVIEYTTVSPTVWMLNVNCGPTANRKVREALAYAWDQNAYETIVGKAPRVDSPVPPVFVGGYKPKIPYNEFNLDKARGLLREAGFPDGGFTLKFSTDPVLEKIKAAEIFQDSLKKLGINLTFEQQAQATWLDTIRNRDIQTDPKRCANMWLLINNPRYPDAHWFLALTYHTGGAVGAGFNWLRYSNPEVDKWIQAGNYLRDPARRYAAYRNAIDIIVNDIPSIYASYFVNRFPMQRSVKGYLPRPVCGLLCVVANFYELWKE